MRDNVHPGEKWEFNGEVAACFTNMLERSIPDYRSMRALTSSWASASSSRRP